jgi:hypothetical protein
MYQNTTIIIRKDKVNDNTPIEIIKGVQQECPLSLVLLNIYIAKISKDSLQVIKQNILMKDLILNTVLLADFKVIVASMEVKMQIAVYALNSIEHTIGKS